jgi:HEAT repeat protein
MRVLSGDKKKAQLAWERLLAAVDRGDYVLVCEFLKSPDVGMRARAAAALGKAKWARAAPELEHGLDVELDRAARLAMVNALASIGSADAAPRLFVLLEDDSEEVRRLALRGLSYLHDPRVLEVAPRFYADGDAFMRQEALDALVRLHAPAGVRALEVLLLAKPSWSRRRAIRTAIRRSQEGWDK